MMRLEPGMIIKTNYSGPYKIKHIERNCCCPSFDEQSEKGFFKASDRKPHLFLTVKNLDDTGEFFLDGFEEKTLKSLDKTICGNKKEPDFDYIEILPSPGPIQQTLF